MGSHLLTRGRWFPLSKVLTLANLGARLLSTVVHFCILDIREDSRLDPEFFENRVDTLLIDHYRYYVYVLITRSVAQIAQLRNVRPGWR